MMQLFTIGLYQRESDGRPKLDEQGELILTYTNDHGTTACMLCLLQLTHHVATVMSFARVWTGFDFQAMRGNIENSGHVQNQVDPLRINPAWRDVSLNL